jgi:hypothetical protein
VIARAPFLEIPTREGCGDAPSGHFIKERPRLPRQTGQSVGKTHGALPTVGGLNKSQRLIKGDDLPDRLKNRRQQLVITGGIEQSRECPQRQVKILHSGD